MPEDHTRNGRPALRVVAGGHAEPLSLRRRVEGLLDRDDAARAVAQLPAQELHALVTELGLDSEQAHELVGYATPRQIQIAVDLDAWSPAPPEDATGGGEHPDIPRLCQWLAAIAAAGPDRLARTVGGLDEELATLVFHQLLRVYDPQLDEIPDEEGRNPVETPDRLFFVEPLADGEAGQAALQLLDLLYRGNAELARSILLAARAALASTLEEEALRFRRGRLADLGFPDPLEALEVYAYLDPNRVRLGEGTADALPKSDQGRAGEAHALAMAVAPELENGFLAEGLRRITSDAERERLRAAMLFLINRVLVADRARPGDAEAVRRAARRVAACVGLGLESLCRGDAARVPEALATVALVRLFRVGVSFGITLRRMAGVLRKAGLLSPIPPQAGRGFASLADDGDRALLQALERRPPELPIGDTAPGATRPFASLAEVRAAAERIERLGTLARVTWEGLDANRAELLELGGKLSPALPELRFSHLIVAAGARALAGERPSARPATPAELIRAAAHAREIGEAAAAAEARSAIVGVLRERELASETALRIVDEELADLAPALRGAREPLDLRELAGIAVRRG